MRKATYELMMEFRAKCPKGQIEEVDPASVENRKSRQGSKPPKLKCKGGKGCTRGLEGADGKFHYVRFSRRQNILCSCWK